MKNDETVIDSSFEDVWEKYSKHFSPRVIATLSSNRFAQKTLRKLNLKLSFAAVIVKSDQLEAGAKRLSVILERYIDEGLILGGIDVPKMLCIGYFLKLDETRLIVYFATPKGRWHECLKFGDSLKGETL